MTLVKYSDFDVRPTTFSTLLDKVFNESVGNATRLNRFRPNVDIIENEKSYEIKVAVPGMEKNDFELDIKDGLLVISGERKFEKKEDGTDYHTIETQYGSFSRSFNLPDHVDVSKVSASYKNGILEVGIPKDEQKTLKTTIKIK
jgi:HSP20 family protein